MADAIEECMNTYAGDPDMLFTGGAFPEDLDAISEEEIRQSRIDRESRNKRARENRRERDKAMRSIGLVKVHGALGGTYWE
jgi:hypothetical protein